MKYVIPLAAFTLLGSVVVLSCLMVDDTPAAKTTLTAGPEPVAVGGAVSYTEREVAQRAYAGLEESRRAREETLNAVWVRAAAADVAMARLPSGPALEEARKRRAALRADLDKVPTEPEHTWATLAARLERDVVALEQIVE